MSLLDVINFGIAALLLAMQASCKAYIAHWPKKNQGWSTWEKGDPLGHHSAHKSVFVFFGGSTSLFIYITHRHVMCIYIYIYIHYWTSKSKFWHGKLDWTSESKFGHRNLDLDIEIQVWTSKCRFVYRNLDLDIHFWIWTSKSKFGFRNLDWTSKSKLRA